MPFQRGFPSSESAQGPWTGAWTELPVALFNFVLRGVGLDGKGVVELGFFYHGEQLVKYRVAPGECKEYVFLFALAG